MKQPGFFLEHICRYAELLVQLGEQHSLESFKADPYLVMAAERAVNNIGEAVAKLDPAFRARHPQIPWQQIRGMRNIITHSYWDVDYVILWEVITVHAPVLKDEIAKLLKQP